MAHTDYTSPRWVEDGMDVIIPVHLVEAMNMPESTAGVWCKVVCAAGHHARVVSDKYPVDNWFHIDEMRVKNEDKHARCGG